MSVRKSERLLNVLITLLVSRTYVTKQRLREVIDDYRNASTDEAFEKMFERDKEDLRALGIPIETGGFDPLFEDEHGYRVLRSAIELPDIDLDADEAAAVGLAARVWQHATLASAASDAVLKLKAAGIDVDPEGVDLLQPELHAEEPSFEAFWEAADRRRPVRFGYRTSSSAHAQERHLEPWGLVSYRARWYVVGRDVDRDAPRMFRLSRVEGEVAPAGTDDAFTIPEGTNLRDLTAALQPDQPDRVATLHLAPGRGVSLRHRAVAGGDAPRRPADGREVVEVPFARVDRFADELVGYGPDVLVQGPEELVAAVVERLEAVVGAQAGGGA